MSVRDYVDYNARPPKPPPLDTVAPREMGVVEIEGILVSEGADAAASIRRFLDAKNRTALLSLAKKLGVEE